MSDAARAALRRAHRDLMAIEVVVRHYGDAYGVREAARIAREVRLRLWDAYLAERRTSAGEA
jgi:hypothetical protein